MKKTELTQVRLKQLLDYDPDMDSAKKAYESKAKELFGEFRRIA